MIKTIIIGTCVIESRDSALRHAFALRQIEAQLKKAGHAVRFVYKSSYTKSNRRKREAYRGVGLNEGLTILDVVRQLTGLPVTTDVHSAEEAHIAGDVVNVLQIPHWLSRSTDVLEAASVSARHVSIKRGVNLTVNELSDSADKIILNDKKCREITLIERGSPFGRDDIILDLRNVMELIELRDALPIWVEDEFRINVGVDISHMSNSVAQIINYGKAVATLDIDTIFVETHEMPSMALCDSRKALPLDLAHDVLLHILEINKLANNSMKEDLINKGWM